MAEVVQLRTIKQQREPRPSIARVIRQIKRHKRAILAHRDELVKLRAELELIDCYVEDAHRSLQDAINELCRVE